MNFNELKNKQNKFNYRKLSNIEVIELYLRELTAKEVSLKVGCEKTTATALIREIKNKFNIKGRITLGHLMEYKGLLTFEREPQYI